VGEIENLENLLLVLRKHGVSKYQSQSFLVEFSDRAAFKQPLVDNAHGLEEKPLSPAQKKIADDEVLFYSAK